LNAVEIIAKKRDGFELLRSEIKFFINSYLKGSIKDYQLSSFLMAVYLKGMSHEETGWLTEIMLESGDHIEFPKPNAVYVDKHSTGGVGDKVSLILAPLAASCGVRVPMLSGRGLGHTGGTLDKLESIPGFKTDLSLEEFKRGVEKIGCVISGQTEQIAPADRMMYALRDVTATIESIPLICGSILSKKFAAGPKGLVFDVKCGNGAFMKNLEGARELAGNLISVGKAMGRNIIALITDMNQPLGFAVGNILEVAESIEFLRGNYPKDLYDVTMELCAEMLNVAGIETDRNKAIKMLENRLNDGSALKKFEEMVEFQKGDLSIFEKPSNIPKAKHIVECKSKLDGHLQEYSTFEIGRLVIELGGGRFTKDDVVDPLVGLVFRKKIGDKVSAGDILVNIHANNYDQAKEASKAIENYIKIGDEKPAVPVLIKERLP